MSGCNCGCYKKLCPVSFGLAVGITTGLAVLCGILYIIYFGPPPVMNQLHIPALTLQMGAMHALFAFIKGTIFGFFVALFYDLFSCCMSKYCRSGHGAGCQCCSTTTVKPSDPGIVS